MVGRMQGSGGWEQLGDICLWSEMGIIECEHRGA